MKYWRIDYYRTHNWIDTKYIRRMRKGQSTRRDKNIVDVQETTEEDYKEWIRGGYK